MAHSLRADAVWASLSRLRDTAPLVHNITNAVVTNSTANILLALGASPVMTDSTEEVEEMVAAASALVINLGTINGDSAAAMRLAAAKAQETGLPWLLDPVAVGVLGYRTRVAGELLWHRPTAIRGNASEIMSLAGTAGGKGRGVDSTAGSRDALAGARSLAEATGAVVAITGAVDLITDGERIVECHNGDPMMTRVTGTGCAVSAIAGAFLAIEPDPLTAVAHALAVFGIAGEIAAEGCNGPGSFQLRLLDLLFDLDGQRIADRVRLR
ncbi:MAG: hydroxyethylthiazole kinase [Alphaproteobacteria bacterium]|jgi:hydroxyethylthiazole kinase|nr:hydroxyethylthiazole kinase [Alphaproteobacteria bacterium]